MQFRGWPGILEIYLGKTATHHFLVRWRRKTWIRGVILRSLRRSRNSDIWWLKLTGGWRLLILHRWRCGCHWKCFFIAGVVGLKWCSKDCHLGTRSKRSGIMFLFVYLCRNKSQHMWLVILSHQYYFAHLLVVLDWVADGFCHTVLLCKKQKAPPEKKLSSSPPKLATNWGAWGERTE